ncbi:hypothetical protein BOTBODRAFT_65213 [Botryobasidium botryosum FD-172 SS1]|uniref:Lytic polysaccharide monooxygenase n=1 Tax=Botryobasidium botryosum (strain FD-172 SS1) TaxID=930990 RepID=A0A067MVP4_BOTB1|nr:hypothetical protein BOTBODRAFT_65213 [Botryobasidium botryosum FD-172 SS1]
MLAFCLLLAFTAPPALAHIALFHPSMWGFNVTPSDFPYDNRPVAPLQNFTFEQWWFHGHLDHPPHSEDVFELPAGGTAHTEIACDKGATSFFASNPGGDVRQGNNPCPNSPMAQYHTNGINDLTGCGLAIAYKSDVKDVQPEDFTIFSVNHTCVWTRFTDFQVPAKMPPCPNGKCICAWFWIHSPDSGGEQSYMNGFQCNVSGSTSNVPISRPNLARRCGAEPKIGKPADISNCTVGAKQPFYWFQAERNNMFEDPSAPPFYTDLYGFSDGSQDDIFEDSPSVAAAAIPVSLSSSSTTTEPGGAVSTSSSAAPSLNAPTSTAISPALGPAIVIAPVPAINASAAVSVSASVNTSTPSGATLSTPSSTSVPALSSHTTASPAPPSPNRNNMTPNNLAGLYSQARRCHRRRSPSSSLKARKFKRHTSAPSSKFWTRFF